jgi:hypothetical protein
MEMDKLSLKASPPKENSQLPQSVRKNQKPFSASSYSFVPIQKQISSNHPLLQPPANDQVKKRASDGSLPALYEHGTLLTDTISSDPPTDDMPSAITGSLDRSVDVTRSRLIEMFDCPVNQMSATNSKDSVKVSQKGRKQVRVEDAEPSFQRPSLSQSKTELPYAQDSPVLSEESMGPTRINDVEDALDEINQALYLELDLMLATMNASLSDDANKDANRQVNGHNNMHAGQSSEDSDTKKKMNNRGFIALEDMPKQLRNIMLSRKPSAMGLDVDIGLKDAVLHIDVKTAFQAMKDESSVSPGNFNFDKDENYSEGLPAIPRRENSSASVFHW